MLYWNKLKFYQKALLLLVAEFLWMGAGMLVMSFAFWNFNMFDWGFVRLVIACWLLTMAIYSCMIGYESHLKKRAGKEDE